MRDELERGFQRLPADQRAVVVLHYYLGLQLTEVAETLGIPDGTARIAAPSGDGNVAHRPRGRRSRDRFPRTGAIHMNDRPEFDALVRGWLAAEGAALTPARPPGAGSGRQPRSRPSRRGERC